MSELIVIAYDDEQKAEQVRWKLLGLQKEHLVDLEDAVVVTRGKDGKVRLNQIHDVMAASLASGTLWGFLVGLIFLNPLLGVAAGAASGALAGALTDIGIDDNFMREVGQSLEPGTSALFVLVRKVTLDRVLPEISSFGGKILRTSLSKEQEEKIQAALLNEARTQASQDQQAA
jgi:uncharacterized membrane protein